MTQPQTRYNVADNSGAKELLHIRTVKGAKLRNASLGNVVVGSIKDALPQGTVKKKSVVKAVIVRVTKPYRRGDGSVIRFDDNAVVIISNEGKPVGTRVFGPIAREIREAGYKEIVSLAPEVL